MALRAKRVRLAVALPLGLLVVGALAWTLALSPKARLRVASDRMRQATAELSQAERHGDEAAAKEARKRLRVAEQDVERLAGGPPVESR
jgi:hypothetical protein